MKKFVLSTVVFTCAAASAQQSAPLWLRNTAISPDATQIAFTYKGDIYAVPVAGGTARQLTTSAAYDSKPLWSPDGSKIAFESDREGSIDIFVMPASGGTPRRLTTHSSREQLRAWLGNDSILFSASIMPARKAAQGGFTSEIYVIPSDTIARPKMLMSWPAQAIDVNSCGTILYQDKKGYEDVLRKHEHSSGTADIWIIENGVHRQLTHSSGQNQNPVWASADNEFFYLSEDSNGTMNVHRRSTAADGAPTALTHFTNHPVRSLSAADNGTLAFSWNGEIYSLAPGASEPTKVSVNIVGDDYVRDAIRRVRTSGATSMSVSPSGEEIAFVLHGDVFVTSVKYNTTKQITNTPQQERIVDFAPDGRTLVYDGERGGLWQLFVASPADENEKNFTYASEIVEKPLYASPDSLPAFQPAFSPDGKKVAFLENRTALRTIDADGKNPTTVLDGKFNYSYTDGDISFEWAPDSRWLLIDYIGIGGWNNNDIALVKADGSEVHDLTQSGYSDGNAKWALDGKAVIWSTDRNGYRSHGSWGSERDVYVMFLDGDAYDSFRLSEEEAALAKADDKKDDDKKDDKDKKDKDKDKAVEPLEFDIENAKYRTIRLTPGAGNYSDYLLSLDGTKFYYLKGGDLWEKDTRKGDTKVLTRGAGYGALELDGKGENLYLLGREISKIALPGGDKSSVDFSAESTWLPAAEREYIFDHMLKQVNDKFYDVNLHGVDWSMYGRAYRRFLPHINNNYDFAELLSEILGELNASHTGGRYYPPSASSQTATLGAFFDPDYFGDGLMVSEVVRRGPLANKGVNIAPGDIILAINGSDIKPGQNYFSMLDGRIGKPTRLKVKRANGKTETISVKPISQSALSDLLYRRWVEHNQAVVDSVSNGRVAYVHIEGMDSPSFRTVFSELLGKYRNHEAVVVDTRWNGGGWLHNDVALLLSGKEYVRYVPRGQYIGSEPFTQWTKPSAMLVNESNYSDAHGTPFTYQTLKLGDVVGAPVPGTMTAVWWESQIDPSIIFGIPQVTSMDLEGNVLENHQLNPDIIIFNTPNDVMNGLDAQLIGATRSLLEKLNKAKSPHN